MYMVFSLSGIWEAPFANLMSKASLRDKHSREAYGGCWSNVL